MTLHDLTISFPLGDQTSLSIYTFQKISPIYFSLFSRNSQGRAFQFMVLQDHSSKKCHTAIAVTGGTRPSPFPFAVAYGFTLLLELAFTHPARPHGSCSL